MKKYRLNKKKFSNFCWSVIAGLTFIGLSVGTVYAVLLSPEW